MVALRFGCIDHHYLKWLENLTSLKNMFAYITCLRNDNINGLHGKVVEGEGKRNNGGFGR